MGQARFERRPTTVDVAPAKWWASAPSGLSHPTVAFCSAKERPFSEKKATIEERGTGVPPVNPWDNAGARRPCLVHPQTVKASSEWVFANSSENTDFEAALSGFRSADSGG